MTRPPTEAGAADRPAKKENYMPKAIRVHETGAANVLRWEDVEVGNPGAGEVRLRHMAVGLNFIDVYFRDGTYPAPGFPFTPGLEAAGVVEAVGPDVSGVAVGDRVAYASPPIGAYSQERLMTADRIVRLPDAIDDRTAAAMMLKGLTTQYLLRRTYRVQPGDAVLIHAAAGGVGLLACQWARHLGATVIGTVGSDEKAELARAHGCEHPIVYTREDFVARVREISGGEGVAVVYDGVGRDTFMKSLDCCRRFGMVVLFGQSSGNVEPFDVQTLNQKGSLYVTRPTLMHYMARREDLEASAAELFEVVGSGAVKVDVVRTRPLSEAAAAHEDLEKRRTTGSTVFIP
jgi:NADPH2:quinone reductase